MADIAAFSAAVKAKITSEPKLLFADTFGSLSFGGQTSGATWKPYYEMNDAGWKDGAALNWNAGTGTPGGITTLSTDSDGLVITASRITAGSVSGVDSSCTWVSNAIQLNPAVAALPHTFYCEIRARIDAFRGAFPAIWLYNAAQRSDGLEQAELDLMESFGYPGTWSSGWHEWHDTPTAQGNVGDWTDDLTQWHNYGLLVSPDRIVYYLDRVEKGRIEHSGIFWGGSTTARTESNRLTQNSAGTALDIPAWFQTVQLAPRLNLAVDPNWLASGDAGRSTSTDPASGASTTMHVDYVAIWDARPPLPFGSDSAFAVPSNTTTTTTTDTTDYSAAITALG